jgi:hypothetical protein
MYSLSHFQKPNRVLQLNEIHCETHCETREVDEAQVAAAIHDHNEKVMRKLSKLISKFALVLLPLIAVLAISSGAEASPFVCFSDDSAGFALTTSNPSSRQNLQSEDLQMAALTCSTKKNLGLGTKAVKLSLQAGSFYLACTGVGAPASLYVQGGALGVAILEIIIGDLPCQDTEAEAIIQERADQAVCAALIRQGVTCQLPLRH